MAEEIKSLRDQIQEDPEILDDIKALIEDKVGQSLITILADFHPADIADILQL